MKKSINLLFILATMVFCALLYWLLFFTDHHGNKLLITLLVAGMVVTAIVILYLFNKYFQKPNKTAPPPKTQVSSH